MWFRQVMFKLIDGIKQLMWCKKNDEISNYEEVKLENDREGQRNLEKIWTQYEGGMYVTPNVRVKYWELTNEPIDFLIAIFTLILALKR